MYTFSIPGNMFRNHFFTDYFSCIFDRFLTVKIQTSAAYSKKLLSSLIMLNKQVGGFWFIALKGKVEVRHWFLLT